MIMDTIRKIRATLEAARCKFNRLWFSFSRIAFRAPSTMGRVSRAFNQADILVLTDVTPPVNRPFPESRVQPWRTVFAMQAKNVIISVR
jgi:hypothetical protein